MPRLLLLRHAKSSWAEPGMADIDRPLAPRGQRTAALMGKAMAERGFLPDLILCSPTRRTRETLAALKPHLGKKTPVAIADDLYETRSKDYRDAIAASGKNADSLLVIGHNPTMQATAIALSGTGDKALIDALSRKFPTVALAVIDFADDVTWRSLPSGGGRLIAFLTPADLGADADD
jgi:phosphohistidine phosphatase